MVPHVSARSLKRGSDYAILFEGICYTAIMKYRPQEVEYLRSYKVGAILVYTFLAVYRIISYDDYIVWTMFYTLDSHARILPKT
jgi:hypothetical protein